MYKRKENIEKVFDTMKNDRDRDRLHVQSAERAEGTIFLTFISLIITSYMVFKISQIRTTNNQ